MTYTLTVDIRKPPLTANEMRRAHYRTIAQKKKEAAEPVAWLVRQHQIPMLERVDVTVTWFAPDARRRDSDSLGPYCKAVLDALVAAQVLRDDDSRYVRQTAMRVEIDRTRPRIEIELKEVTE
ncbi:RusA family crossover junction endodeoxyribonuclease [Rhodococcus qingshengii]|uniref:RusA family crossover junction endodeoxyribonuclease n=1 Tax=Rhodococcus TaxID=1827 RepID=UPI001E3AD585|nr:MULTISPECIES: RusA family crossover junction endodeoxyribonuclease [Rhodococcus]MCD2099600.1 RusA family crossover junction endodeoxyribonuclease [Rhodococcus rhodochrous]MCD2123968.1 RusA family crossover junction endodeoxyribonuclease [Rhodococcus rhodochrous]MCQ4136601.1 RusA family crossover junction endodeoxyribonuclease [Rhodococcus rhodochrous]MDJ0490614.1 RusA family crossover junction endodeoxyribonuclease [Rhodococcus qingshengii]